MEAQTKKSAASGSSTPNTPSKTPKSKKINMKSGTMTPVSGAMTPSKANILDNRALDLSALNLNPYPEERTVPEEAPKMTFEREKLLEEAKKLLDKADQEGKKGVSLVIIGAFNIIEMSITLNHPRSCRCWQIDINGKTSIRARKN